MYNLEVVQLTYNREETGKKKSKHKSSKDANVLRNFNTFIEVSHFTRWLKFHFLSMKMKTCKSSCCQCVDRKDREDSGPAEIARATIVMLRPENLFVHS